MNVPRAPGPARRSPIVAHYAAGQEAGRLESGIGQLEGARTRELLERYLPPPPARVADVGGGPGAYAVWLAGQGYTVDLLDLVPLHVEQARRRFEALGLGRARALVGDARALPYAPASQDAALLIGPLYHLPARTDRLTALREAWRVLRPGGVVVAATISRFAPLLDGFFRELVRDPAYEEILGRDLESGWHENPSGNPAYFTTAYFHRPEEVAPELEEASFEAPGLFAVEGPFWCLPDFDRLWAAAGLRQRLLAWLRRVEREPSLLGASAHLLAVGRKAG
jgi:ubiquinone/menaquinone biosynthesis C-methylase UbiE